MTATNPERVKAIFGKAMEKSGSERAAFNDDGSTTLADFLILQNNYNKTL